MLVELRVLGGFSVRVDGREIPLAACPQRRLGSRVALAQEGDLVVDAVEFERAADAAVAAGHDRAGAKRRPEKLIGAAVPTVVLLA